jgi:hypothetical protein
MNRRSLLDYLAENDGPDAQVDAPRGVELLHQRLAELEARLAAATRAEEPAASDPKLSSQIESILRRPQEQVREKRAVPRAATPAPLQQYARVEPQASPPAVEMSAPQQERSEEFTRFVEAVHLIGRAAHRFLQEPPRQVPAPREPAGPSQDTLMLTAALKETVAAFQAMTSNLATAAGEIRRVAEVPRIEAPKAESPKIEPPARRISRDDAALFRLQDDLEDLRERLSAMTRRRSRDGY